MVWKIFPKIINIWITFHRVWNCQKGVRVALSFFSFKFDVKLCVTFFYCSYILLAKSFSLLIWGGSIAVGLLLAIVMTNLVWQRSQSTPTLTTVNDYYYPIYNVKFSAITLCNNNVAYRPAVEQITKLMYANEFNFYIKSSIYSNKSINSSKTIFCGIKRSRDSMKRQLEKYSHPWMWWYNFCRLMKQMNC